MERLGGEPGGESAWYREVALHAHVTTVLLWVGVLAGPVTTGLLSALAPVYVVVVVVAKSVFTVGSPTPGNGRRNFGPFFARWAVLFPVAVFALNAIALWLLGRVLATPSLRALPLVERVVTPWTVWDATGVVILVVATAGIGFAVGLVGALARAAASISIGS